MVEQFKSAYDRGEGTACWRLQQHRLVELSEMMALVLKSVTVSVTVSDSWSGCCCYGYC